MANALGIELKGKVVVLRDDQYRGNDLERLFKAESGFGLSPSTGGNAVFGEFLSDGERARVEGYQIARLATDEEVEAVKELREAADAKKRRAQVVLTITLGDVEDYLGHALEDPAALESLREEMADPIPRLIEVR